MAVDHQVLQYRVEMAVIQHFLEPEYQLLRVAAAVDVVGILVLEIQVGVAVVEMLVAEADQERAYRDIMVDMPMLEVEVVEVLVV